MNKLVIVGNGFDLAHGMKTGYNDFMLWYLKDSYESAYNNTVDGIYEDDAIKITAENWCPIKIMDAKGISEFMDYFYNRNELNRMITLEIFEDNPYSHVRNPFKTKIKSEFIRSLVLNCSKCTWVEIENEYYEALKNAIKSKSQKEADNAVINLNKAMSVIIQKLQTYLTHLKPSSSQNEYFDLLTRSIKSDDMVISSPTPEIKPIRTMVLNFNYTSTIERYIEDKYNTKINYIHGRLNDQDNPIVFGFGDELDDQYAKFELDKTKGIFKYIKSFWYFRTRNYHNLIRFIQSNDYQVCVLGHSCGLSDRTMLNMIFEDSNCKSVKIYHHKMSNGKDNYTELTYEIAKHFKNKPQMRKKIVPFDEASYMPQVN